ncbi:MAG: hypothetical protein K8F91_07500, partial [Candidatus Obscuribacterales bacterium]|nr:hypothetical protein [Candidatus Obscuribacterales bacterium]
MFTRVKLAILLGAGIVVAGALTLPALIPHSATNLADVDFPSNPGVRLEFHEGERSRTVELYPNGVRQHATAQHNDGSVTDFFYREDSTLREAITRSPETNGVRTVLRHALIEPDGVTYTLETEYFDNGAKKKVRQLLDPLTTWTRYFFTNGVTQKDQQIKRGENGWFLVSEDVRREDESLEQKFRLADDGSFLTERFSKAGTLVAKIEKNKQNTSYTEAWYKDDGKTPTKRVDQDSSGTKVTILDAKGQTVETYDFYGDISKNSSIWRKVYVDGVPVLEQWWEFRPDGTYKIDLVKTFFANGEESLLVWIADDGITIETEVIFHDDRGMRSSRTIKHYHKDGSLKEVEELDGSNKKLSETTHPEGNEVRGIVDPNWLSEMTIDLPPQAIPYSPPM